MFAIERLADWYRLEPFQEFQNTFLYHIRTPAHHFVHVAKFIESVDRCIVIAARDSFEQEFAVAILREVAEIGEKIAFNPSAQKIVAWLDPKRPFDHLLIVGPAAHGTYAKELPELHRITFLVLPIADCEFSGDESPEMIQLMRRDAVSTLDWNRAVVPKLMMRFYNEEIKVGSIGPQLRFARLDFCLRQILEMKPGFQKSFVCVKNFRHQECAITRPAEDFRVSYRSDEGQAAVVLPVDKISAWLHGFLFKGMDS